MFKMQDILDEVLVLLGIASLVLTLPIPALPHPYPTLPYPILHTNPLTTTRPPGPYPIHTPPIPNLPSIPPNGYPHSTIPIPIQTLADPI